MKLTKWALTTCAAITAILFINSCSSEETSETTQPKVVSVKTWTVNSQLNQLVRSFPARIAASDSTNVAFKVGGQISNIHFQAGDDVTKGDLLLELDATDYQLGYDQAKANYDLAKATFDRISKINKQNLASASDFDNAKANLDLARVGLNQAKNQLNYTKLTAPYSGVLVRVIPKQFEFTNTAQPVAVIQSQDNIDIKFQIPSEIIAKVQSKEADRLVDIRFPVIKNQTFKASLKDFQSEGDQSTRSFSVTLTMPRPDKSIANLLPGMEAYVDIDLSIFTPTQHTLIPSHAVFSQQNQSYVFKVVDNKAVRTNVSLGELALNQVEITSGLENDDVIISAGVHKIIDGQSVTIWQAN